MEGALDAVARGDRPLVFGGDYPTADGTCVRDFVHVLDVASAHALAVDALESGSGSAVYNVGCGTGHSVLQVLDRIREVTGIDFLTESRPRRGGDPARVVASSERIRRELGWAPRLDLTDMVRSRWEAYEVARVPHAPAPAGQRPQGHHTPLADAGSTDGVADAAESDQTADGSGSDTDGRTGRIQVISASIGAGHDGAARELVARLAQRGFEVDVIDLLSVFPRWLGTTVRDTYHTMLKRQPWIYDLLYQIACTFAGAAPATRLLLRPMRGRLLRRLPSDTVAVVSTFPLGAQILGPLRRSGRLTVPAITYLTDFGVHPIWVAPGMDMHCAAHEVSRGQARELGAQDVQVAGRLVAPAFRPAGAAARNEARRVLRLPTHERLALLVAGSWGVGAVEHTVAEVARSGAATPVVVCAGNTELHRRLRQQGVAYVLGWVDDMAGLLRAVDVLVENAGGLTAMEAMACGVPVITYRPIAGHGTANAAAMARAGVARWVRGAAALGPAITELIDNAPGGDQCQAGLALFESDPATAVADLAKAGLRQRSGGIDPVCPG
jgi:processive 1,2-diacylglycerol beta-glucosyltransferase